MGESHCSLAQILGGQGAQRTMKLENSSAPNKDHGTLTVSAQELEGSNEWMYVQFYASKLVSGSVTL